MCAYTTHKHDCSIFTCVKGWTVHLISTSTVACAAALVGINALCGGNTALTVPTVRHTWTSVPITSVGSTNLRHPNTFSYVIPSVIPSTAKNVLVFAAIHCGTANAGVSQQIKVFTQDGPKHYEKYVYMLTYNQPAYNTNSENMWFPMPTNRRIYMTVLKDTGANCGAQVFVTGYN